MVDHSEISQSVLARGLKITEFSGDKINPQPVTCEETDILLRQYLSPRKLCLLSGVDDLEDVKTLELKVDTSEMSLGNFGSLVPNLWELKLSTSIIHSIRDLGSSLHGLNILWMSRCCLQDLDGIGSLSNLKELYLSFNDISEISSLSMLEYLEILDLECNKIDCISQIQYLSFCTNLKSLTLQGNPVCMKASPESESTDYSYRKSVVKYVPQLKYFDDKPMSDVTPGENVNVFNEDWDYLLKLQQDLHFDESLFAFEDNVTTGIRPSSATSYMPTFHPATGIRPGTGLRPHSAMETAAFHTPMNSSLESYIHGYETDVFESPESISELTDGSVFCGNPSKALRSRIKQKTAPSGKEKMLFPQYSFKPEHTFDELPNRDENLADIIKQLEEWKVEYEKCQRNIKESCAPQILKIEEDNIKDNTEECTESDIDSLKASSCLSDIDTEEYNITQSMSESIRERNYNEDHEYTDKVHHITSELKNIPNCDLLPKVRKSTKFPNYPSSQQHCHELTRPLSTSAIEKNDQLFSRPPSFKEPIIKNKTYSNKQEKKANLKYLSRPSSAKAVIGYANASNLLPSLPSISIKQKLYPSN